MYIKIEGYGTLEVEKVDSYSPGTVIEADGMKFVIFENTEVAGEAARKYWEDLAQDDPTEFTCLVGEKNLIQWGLEQYAGPGSTKVGSLNEWLDLWLDTPEEHFAGYDGGECAIERIAHLALDVWDHVPDCPVAYRNN